MYNVLRICLFLGGVLHTTSITCRIDQPRNLFDNFGIHWSKIFIFDSEEIGANLCRNLSIFFYWLFCLVVWSEKSAVGILLILLSIGTFITASTLYFGRLLYRVEKLLRVHSYQCSREGVVVSGLSCGIGYVVLILTDSLIVFLPALF
jgi:hypothetical protein